MISNNEKPNILKELIGKGSSSSVYKIINLLNNKIYALKESLSKDVEFLFKNEINIFKQFKNECPYIVEFYNYLLLPNQINLELEYCQYGSLRDLLKKAKKKKIHLNEYEISSIIYMVLSGLNFMHKKNLINRDIKCKNILVNKDGIAKLCDFGISQVYKRDMYPRHKAGSPYWMAPELINMEKYDKSIDIWSLGITCIELAEYEPPYINFDKNEALIRIKKFPPKGLSEPEKWSDEFNDFVYKCLNVDRFERPTCEELLQHEFINIIDKKKLNRKLLVLQFLSRVGCKVLYNKKNVTFKNKQNSDELYSKTFYNTNNRFRPQKPADNFNSNTTEKNPNHSIRRNNESSLDYSIKNSINYKDVDLKHNLNKLVYRKIGEEDNNPDTNIKKFVVQSKILQKKIVNINNSNNNNNELNDSEQYDVYSSPVNKSLNQNKFMKTRNKFQKNTYTNTNVEESFNIKERENENNINNNNNNNNQYKNSGGDKKLFLGRLKYKKRINNLSFNNSLNNSEMNYINYKRTMNPCDNEENINEENPLRYSCYNQNQNNFKIKQVPNPSKTINIGENYISVKKIININNNISRNYINLRQPTNKIIYGSINNFKNKGDITLSTTFSK